MTKYVLNSKIKKWSFFSSICIIINLVIKSYNLLLTFDYNSINFIKLLCIYKQFIISLLLFLIIILSIYLIFSLFSVFTIAYIGNIFDLIYVNMKKRFLFTKSICIILVYPNLKIIYLLKYNVALPSFFLKDM